MRLKFLLNHFKLVCSWFQRAVAKFSLLKIAKLKSLATLRFITLLKPLSESTLKSYTMHSASHPFSCNLTATHLILRSRVLPLLLLQQCHVAEPRGHTECFAHPDTTSAVGKQSYMYVQVMGVLKIIIDPQRACELREGYNTWSVCVCVHVSVCHDYYFATKCDN